MRVNPVDGTKVTDAGLKALSQFITRLSLRMTQISSAGLEQLRRLPELQDLWLDNTQINDDALKHLSGLKKLLWLFLDNTLVTDAGLDQLKALPQLAGLSLQGTRVTHEGVKKLQQALPKCAISWKPQTKDERQSRASPDQPGG